MREVVPEGAERTVDMRLLSAFVAIGAGKRRAAIQAISGFVPMRLARFGLDRAGD